MGRRQDSQGLGKAFKHARIMAPPPDKLLKFYRRVATHGWSASKHYTYTHANPCLRNWLARRLRHSSTVLSVGCGSGELEIDLRKQNHRVVGMDISAEMLRTASCRGLSSIVQADAHFLPFRSSCFSVVIFPESLGYLKLEEAIRETTRVLTNRGRLVITTYPFNSIVHSLYAQSTLAELRRHLAEAGLRIRTLRFLRTTYKQVKLVRSERRSTLLYILAAKEPSWNC